MTKVLITGGAGFIGSHLADELLRTGYEVHALDSLIPQVHGAGQARPGYLDKDIELQIGDIRDSGAVERALDGVDGVFHLASAVGVGQSMYEVAHYTSVNDLGTAVLLEALIKRPVQRLVLASSMSIYGEGLYVDSIGNLAHTVARDRSDLERGAWEPHDANGLPLNPTPTPETKSPSLASVYALNKYAQERMCIMIGQAYAIPTVALRLFNVFGIRQSLSNPYTGVLAIFASRFLNNKPPLVFEDGNQRRDFVSVYDVARAFRLAYECREANGQVFNIGGGIAYTITEVAETVRDAVGSRVSPLITGKYRVGDIRHCYADISLAEKVLGYRPAESLREGMLEFVAWLNDQTADDLVERAAAELSSRGLTI